MTVIGGDPLVLAAAAGISDAYQDLDDACRRVAAEELTYYPVLATDPRMAGPVLVDPGIVHRRTAQVLTAAGGGYLHRAAERLVDWAAPVVGIVDLNQRLEAWLPDGAVMAPAARLTRRLLCDAAGLTRTPWSTFAVTVTALETFASAAMDAADDAELINENALRRASAELGFDDAAVEALCEVCGFERLFGSLAVRRNRFSLCKAALLDLGRSTSRHEIAELTGLSSEAAGMALSTCASVVRTGYNRWAAHHAPTSASPPSLQLRLIWPTMSDS